MRINCPRCGVFVEARHTTTEGNYPGAMVLDAFQVRLGPEHRRPCMHWRAEVVASPAPPLRPIRGETTERSRDDGDSNT